MKLSAPARQHSAALRALLVLTGILGLGYPLLIWLIAQAPGLNHRAQGSIITVDQKPVGSRLIGQAFVDSAGNPLPQYFQSRPSAGGYNPMESGAGNRGPEDVVDTPGRLSLLTRICARSLAIGRLEGIDGSRPFCTDTGIGAVLSVIGPRDLHGTVVRPARVVSVNELCTADRRPFLASYRGVQVECAEPGEDYSIGQTVPVRGAASDHPQVPPDAVTASASGLDPHISPAYADIQIARVARARHVTYDQVRDVVDRHRGGPTLGFLGEPHVNVVTLNLELDQTYPLKPCSPPVATESVAPKENPQP